MTRTRAERSTATRGDGGPTLSHAQRSSDDAMTQGSSLRARLAQPGIIIAPGAFDALSARVIQEAGAEVIYATGAGFANSQFAVPDVGLTTMTETVEHVRRIVA